MMTYPLPKLPWQVIASDVFELCKSHYVVLVDTHSDYVEVCPLPDLTSGTLIEVVKQAFATHGTPAVLLSDNGPNYASQEFQQFAKDWDFKHITSSPHHHKSNGRAEAAVKTVKKIFKRAIKDRSDKWAALLEWRNTITPNMDSSPVQRIMSRRTRSLLPCASSKLKPDVQKEITPNIMERRKKAKYWYDRGAKELPKLVIGQPVRVKTHPHKPDSSWITGQVIKEAAPRSFIVEVNGKQYRRNRVHLRDSLDTHINRERSPSPTPESEKQVARNDQPDKAIPQKPDTPAKVAVHKPVTQDKANKAQTISLGTSSYLICV